MTRCLHLAGAGLHRHAGLNLPNAGRGIDALPDIHHANAADSDRIFVLLVAERGNGDPCIRAASKIVVPAGTVTGAPSIVSCTLAAKAVELMRDSRWAKQTPAVHWRRSEVFVDYVAEMLQHRRNRNRNHLAESANRSQLHRAGKFVEQLPVGAGGAVPSVHPVSISTIFCEPMRQGTHLPQDSLR